MSILSTSSPGKTKSITIFRKIQRAKLSKFILFNCWLLTPFFRFSLVGTYTYKLS